MAHSSPIVRVDQGFTLTELLVPAAIILRRGSEAAEAGGVVRLLPQDDRLLRHVEVVLTQLVLHDDRDPRGQGLSLEHVQLASLSLAVKDAGDEDGEEQHGDDDQARHDEGEEVLLVR